MTKSLISISAIFASALLITSCAGHHGMSSGQMALLQGQTAGVDMQGNVVELPANFTYGGDNQAAYNEGHLATGVKDPSVCGSFEAAKCSVAHLK